MKNYYIAITSGAERNLLRGRVALNPVAYLAELDYNQ